MTERHYTARVVVTPGELLGERCDLTILKDEVINYHVDAEGEEIPQWTSSGPQMLYQELDAGVDDDHADVLREAREALEDAGWELDGDWEQTDTGYIAVVTQEKPITPAELRSAREALGLTYDEFAREAGFNPRSVRAWEYREKTMLDRNVPIVLDALERLVQQAQAEVDHLVATADPGQPVLVADPHSEWSRRVAYRAAERLGPAARIVYPD